MGHRRYWQKNNYTDSSKVWVKHIKISSCHWWCALTAKSANGGIQAFPAIKVTMFCQVRMQTCEMVLCSLRSSTHFCGCYCIMWSEKPKYPQLELHGWQGYYTRGGIGVLVFLFYICDCFILWFLHNFSKWFYKII